jgi:hypothetical protein
VSKQPGTIGIESDFGRGRCLRLADSPAPGPRSTTPDTVWEGTSMMVSFLPTAARAAESAENASETNSPRF